PLKMMTFQIGIEQRFFAASPDGSQKAPAQRLTDFIAGKQSSSLADNSYAPGLYPARVDRLLPKSVASRLQKGFAEFGRKQRGFVTELATVIGDETRTSSPVRIPRMPDSMCHIGVAGLYPAGEGAGYAGGIVSAAIDGERVAEAVIQQIQSTISGI
ncbi:MAG: FAD-binding protein, partial [Muribaculaceae bacterium]|nr:FAD-binding protein [Muribaculaceae bacterium]